ncbi:MAG: CocE/NonD family hydrolase, partial [Mesorhizobium sp.]
VPPGQGRRAELRSPGNAVDQRQVDLRQDRLVFTSEPLREGLEVTGPLKAVLYVSSSATDTDFVVQLSDVYPDGRVYNLRTGIARARYREGYKEPKLMTPGEIYLIEVDMQATGNWFGPGHRIRVQVSSSSFPHFARNLNTGSNNATETTTVVAKNTIHHERHHPSHILLPVVE